MDKDEKQGSKNPPPGAPPHLNGKRAEPDSGLIDLKALADGEISTSMNNIEKQREEQRDAAILASTSSVSLSQIVLPIAGREGKTPIDTVADAPVAKAALAGGAKAAPQKSRTGLVVAIVLGLGAAAGGAFWYIKSSEKKKTTSEDNVVAAGGGGALPTTGQGQVPADPPGGTMVAGGGASDPSGGGGPVVQPLDTAGGNQVTAPAGNPDDKKAADDKKLAAANDKKAADDKKLTPEEKKAAADKKAAAAEDKKAAADKAATDKAADKVAAADKDKLETGGPTTPKDDSQSEIQKLLAGGGDDKKVDDAPKKTSLDKDEIKAGMNKIKAIVQNCARTAKVVGVIKVRATIAASGSVTSGSVTGEFASNPVASCVKDAVMAASFPSWTGSPMTVNYSYSVD